MSKRLILVLALVLVAGFAVAAYAEVQNVKVSGDITVYGLSRSPYLATKASTTPTGVELIEPENAAISIARVRIDADLTDNVAATVRLLNERYWGNEIGNAGNGVSNTEVDLDLAYVTLKEFLYSPLNLTIGRQELHFGNDMILGDPDTNNAVSANSPLNGVAGAWPRDPDLSARKSFDAVRATLNYDPLVIDLVAANISQTTLNDGNSEALYGINANYALSKKTTIEGYFWDRVRGRAFNTTIAANQAKNDVTYVVGGRLVTQPIDNLTYQLEVAGQFGNVVNTAANTATAQRRALGIETSLSYDLKHAKRIGKYKPTITAVGAYFSGNRGNGDVNKAWDPMYENQTTGSLANALFNQTNVIIAGLVGTAKPVDDITLKGEYYAYWWDKNLRNTAASASTTAVAVLTNEALVMTNNKFAGQEIDATVTYDYTEDVQFGLMGGWLVPGGSFSDKNNHLASEVIGSMKVTF